MNKIIFKKILIVPLIFIFLIFSGCVGVNIERLYLQKKEEALVRVAVIDTGVSTTVISEEFVLEGYNYLYDNADTNDKIGHGTSVSSLIIGSNGDIIRIIPLVYATLDVSGKQVIGDVEIVASAIVDAVDRFQCRIICIPSGTTEDNDKLHEAVKYAKENDVLVISCAGNYELESQGTRFYPGAYEEVMCVGSCDEFGEVSSFSQSGEYVDLLAIGEDLAITTLKGTKIRGEGTSYSAAVVASKAAAFLFENQKLSSEELWKKIIDSSPIVEP